MVPTLLFLASLASQELQHPVLEKDPWAGFQPGSFVVRETSISNQVRTETTTTLKSIEGKARTFTVLRQGEEEEQAGEFVPFSAGLLADGSGYKLTGKSQRAVSFGPAKVKALIREISVDGDASGSNIWKVATADEIPGGLFELQWAAEDEKTRFEVSCAFKAIEKLKIQGKELSCARFDVKESQRSKFKKTIEGSYWLSTQIPGLLAKSVLKVTDGKEVKETTVQTTQFEAKN